MVSINVSYPDFSAGEISPRLWGRHDLQVFFRGARRIENFETQVTGGANFRNGFVLAAKTKGGNKALLYTFDFRDNIAFTLEITAGFIRFYQGNGRVQETAKTITGVTQANPAVVTSASHGYSNGDSVWIDNIVGMEEVNRQEFTVAGVTTNTFQLSGVDSTGYTAYASGGTAEKIVQVATPYAEDDLFSLKFAQQGRDLYISHPSHNPRKVSYTSATSWGIASHSPTGLTLSANNYPAAVGFYEQRLVYGGSNNNPNTLFFSKPALPDNFTIGTAVDDGIAYTIAGPVNGISWLRGTSKFLGVGAIGDVYQVTGGIDGVVTPTSISVRPSNGYGTADINPIGKGAQIFYPQSNNLILRSFEFDFQQDSYIPVNRTTVSDHITKSGLTQIAFQEGWSNTLWACRTDGVLAGLTIEETEAVTGWFRFKTDGQFVSAATLPRAKQYDQLWVCVKRGDTHYVEYAADAPEYTQRDDIFSGNAAVDTRMWENIISEEQKRYIHVDSCLSYYGDLLATQAITPSAVTGNITVTAAGSIFTSAMVGRQIWRKSITGDEEGRAIITGYTSGTVVSCTVIEDFNSTASIPAGEWFLTTDEVVGIDHLEGRQVTIVTDGGQHPKKAVTDGAVALDFQASVVHVGLGYTGSIESNDLEGGGTNGPAQTKQKSVHAVGFRLLNTLYAKFGTGYYNLNTIEMRTARMKMDRPPLLFTGDVKEVYANAVNDPVSGGWERQKRAIVVQDQPFPCTVQLIVPYMSVSN